MSSARLAGDLQQLHEWRYLVTQMRVDAQAKVRTYARMREVSDQAFVDALVNALGDVSVDEALAAIDREVGSQPNE